MYNEDELHISLIKSLPGTLSLLCLLFSHIFKIRCMVIERTSNIGNRNQHYHNLILDIKLRKVRARKQYFTSGWWQ